MHIVTILQAFGACVPASWCVSLKHFGQTDRWLFRIIKLIQKIVFPVCVFASLEAGLIRMTRCTAYICLQHLDCTHLRDAPLGDGNNPQQRLFCHCSKICICHSLWLRILKVHHQTLTRNHPDQVLQSRICPALKVRRMRPYMLVHRQ